MPRRESETERIRRITNTPTIVPIDAVDTSEQPAQPPKRRASARASGMMTSQAELARFRYQRDDHLWRRCIERLLASASVSAAQAQSWLQPCHLSTMQLPSGEVLSAHLQAHTTFAADHLRRHYAGMIRLMLQAITGQQVILFIRGPQGSPWQGPPDGYDVA